MRPGVLVLILTTGAGVLLALVWLQPKAAMAPAMAPDAVFAEPPGEMESETAQSNPSTLDPSLPPLRARAKANRPSNAETNAQAQAEQRETDVDARIAELRELAIQTDAASLEKLLSELRNPNREIRFAAIDIISQCGNRTVISRLEEAAALTEDAEESKAIADAIEFLNLPSLTEVLNQARQER